MQFKYIVVFENNSDKFDIGYCRVKVKVNVGLQILSNYVHLIVK